jgi:hypothetical protein
MSNENQNDFNNNSANQHGLESLVSMTTMSAGFPQGLRAIASAYGDYTKKSFEDTKSYVEKLSGVRSIDKAIEVQTEFARSAYETFVQESQKIAGLYSDLAKQTYGGLVSKLDPPV